MKTILKKINKRFTKNAACDWCVDWRWCILFTFGLDQQVWFKSSQSYVSGIAAPQNFGYNAAAYLLHVLFMLSAIRENGCQQEKTDNV